jgi:uncharacterized protein YbjT (DUF2867 family)
VEDGGGDHLMTTSTSGTPRTVLLAGATGLVGGLALQRLLDGTTFDQVVVVARRPPGRTHGRLRSIVTEFDALEARPPVPAAVALCALGTTIKKAGSQAAFRAVDRDAVVAFARWAHRGGARSFVLVSSVGAAPDAGNFYLRVKGEAEQAVAAIGYDRFVSLRPSMLLGPRAERRPLEALGQALFPALNPLLRGGWSRYRSLAADTVAAAMLTAADGPPGRVVWEHDGLVAAAGGHPPA